MSIKPKIKVAIINPVLPHYRVPLMKILGNSWDLTYFHFGADINNIDLNFNLIKLEQVSIGPFLVSKSFLYSKLIHFDVVISEANLRYLDRLILMINPFRSFKWINWGIGVSASYDRKFGAFSFSNYLRTILRLWHNHYRRRKP
jgi:hypothetical protein